MCGVSGIINFNGKQVEEEQLKVMMKKIKHRGPDDEGTYIDKNVGLGFVRLSILDLSIAGHQPMNSSDGRYVIIYNGEVYNYVEIRDELKSKYTFKTGTDTEVILTAYLEWGEKCLDKFNGMFAIVIYDTLQRELFIARDRFGIKPLYYYQDDERFYFASEIKAILPLLQTKTANDQIILDYIIYNRTDHTNQTFFSNIIKLEHGHYLKIKNNKITSTCWYDLEEKVANTSYKNENYLELLTDAVRLILRSDVPVGVSLSGGLDSSSVTSLLLKKIGVKDLQTFSAVYDKSEPTDESKFIDLYRNEIKGMHFVSPSAETFKNDYVDFVDSHNEPVSDVGPYIQYKVMQLAKKYVTVTIDGQGADEQLGGYHNFFGAYYKELFYKMKFGSLVKENYHYLKKHRSMEGIKYMMYYMMPAKIKEKYSKNIFEGINDEFFRENFQNSSIVKDLYHPNDLVASSMQHFNFKLEHLLKWDDLNAMHFSVESRVPFLDHRLVEKTLSLPSDQIIKNGQTKAILRESMKGILPEEIRTRIDKKGFSNPRDKWFKTKEFQEIIQSILHSKKFNDLGYFDLSVCEKKYQMHLDGKKDHSRDIWKWINLSTWHERFIEN
jgi:asparagine synthase (glutamine-hydrolysing)